MNVFVTGGSGFIGTNLTADLIEKGHHVTIYDKCKSSRFPEKCIVGDIRDREKLSSSMSGTDVVYHLAAEHRDDVRPTSLYYDVNVRGAENLVFALTKNKVKRLIFTSTVAVYGLNSIIPDENSPINPFNDYGNSKYKAEVIFQSWAKDNRENNLVIVRPAVIFGEKNRGNVYNLLQQIASKKFIMVGNGKNMKSMGYVLNLSQFLVALLNSEAGVSIYNYADKPDITTNELIKITKKTLGLPHKRNVRIPYILGFLGGFTFDIVSKITRKTFSISTIRIKKFCADTRVSAEKLKEINFIPPYTLSRGLERMISSEFKRNTYKT